LSQYALGILYRAGAFGVVPQDLVQAYAWFNIAATQGNEDAARERKGLGETITNEQRARARELSREYWEAYVLPFRN
jgi:TPR repeat protein